MRIDVMNDAHEPVAYAEVDPAALPATVGDVTLDWTDCIDNDTGTIRQCPACRGREHFVRKDFPQRLGMALVVIAGVTAFVLFTLHQTLTALAVLGAMVLVDGAIYLFTGKVLVCYRCRAEFRGVPFRSDQGGWDLEIGEKYRHLIKSEGDGVDPQ